MSITDTGVLPPGSHHHLFLGTEHARHERRAWWVIALCTTMMVVEIGGGLSFGSLALIADGLHMSTHASALLLAALAYTFARRHAADPRFTFGTGKLGDLAGFASAIILAMIGLLIAYEAVDRLLHPVAIDYREAIVIAVLGLVVNIVSAGLLSRGGHDHGHGHGHGGHAPDHEEPEQSVIVGGRTLGVSVVEDGVPPRFRLRFAVDRPSAERVTIETLRPDGARQLFAMIARGQYLESVDEIPEPHAFTARIRIEDITGEAVFAEDDAHHAGATTIRDNNFRSALVHILADAAVSGLVIIGLVLGWLFGLSWMDPLVGIAGATVIGTWAFALVRDTGLVLLDTVPDPGLARRLRQTIEADGDRLVDLHLWRLGPGHLGAIVSIATDKVRDAAFYRQRLQPFHALSHLTVEVDPSPR
ncbi:MAG: CDF family Co(II)/Ni(II) efflux transporter DmeF [Azospirillaceae bacterium]|nr:CDF family Co(II)/Ni(II) efflux transporter DmeF [Azospirillaceae bacterium]